MAALIALATLAASVVMSAVAAPSLDARIVGGVLAPDHSFPFLVGLSISKLSKSGTFWCGGSLIAPNFVVTAAHCLEGDTYDVKVKLGIQNRLLIPRDGGLIEVHRDRIRVHERFTPNNTDNDIALVELPLNVTLTDDVQVIALAPRFMDEEFLEGQGVTAAGWGKRRDNMTGISEDLVYVDVTVIDQEQCRESFHPGIITSKNICVDGSQMKGTCKGDSGGPLVYQAADDSRYLVGVTSFGSNHGCDKRQPSAFTRVTAFLDWIAKHTGLVTQ